MAEIIMRKDMRKLNIPNKLNHKPQAHGRVYKENKEKENKETEKNESTLKFCSHFQNLYKKTGKADGNKTQETDSP